MAAVTAALVKELREMTGAGMMDCKKALTATDGDMDKAVDFLREKGLAGAQKKAGRIAAEGIVDALVGEDGKSGDDRGLIRACKRSGNCLLGGYGLGKLISISGNCGKDLPECHIDHCVGLNAYLLAVVLEHDLASGFDLFFGEYTVTGKKLDILVIKDVRHAVGSGSVVAKSPDFGCFLDPCIVVTVSVEEDPLVILDGLPDHLVKGLLKVLSSLKSVGIDLE